MWKVILSSLLVLMFLAQDVQTSDASAGCCDSFGFDLLYCYNHYVVKAKVLNVTESYTDWYPDFPNDENLILSYALDIQEVYKSRSNFEEINPVMRGIDIFGTLRLEVGATYIISNGYLEDEDYPELGKYMNLQCCGIHIKLGVDPELDEEIMGIINNPPIEKCKYMEENWDSLQKRSLEPDT